MYMRLIQTLEDAVDLISRLLVLDPDIHLGYGSKESVNDLKAFKNHCF